MFNVIATNALSRASILVGQFVPGAVSAEGAEQQALEQQATSMGAGTPSAKRRKLYCCC